MRTLSGEAPTDLGGIVAADSGRLLLPFSGASAELLSRLEGAGWTTGPCMRARAEAQENTAAGEADGGDRRGTASPR